MNILDPEMFDPEKSKEIYNKTDEFIEKSSKLGYFLMAKATPIFWISPKVIISYFIYFTTNSGNDSFTLPVLVV